MKFLRRSNYQIIIFGAGIFLLTWAPLRAERLEIAPFYGLRFGGGLKNEVTGNNTNLDSAGATGATLDVPISGLPEKLELLYSQQNSHFSGENLTPTIDVKVDVWQAGLLREYNTYDHFRPFLVGTLGVTNFSFSSSLEDQNLFSIGAGGGFKYLINENIGFRLDTRVYVSFVEGSGAIACDGGCVFKYEGSTFVQGEITPSLMIIF